MTVKFISKKQIKVICFSLLIFSVLSLKAQSKQDSALVGDISKKVTTLFVNNQMNLFADLWDDHAVFITIAGIVAKGKDKILDMHALGKYIIDSSTNIQLQMPVINFITNDMVITYTVWSGLVFKIQGQKGPIQSGYLTCVIKKEKNEWKILSATNATNGSYAPTLQFTEYNHSMWKMLGIDEQK